MKTATTNTLLVFCFLFFIVSVKAGTYTFSGPGDWDDITKWSPSYPGTMIQENDEIIIDGDCTISLSVNNSGLITVNNGARFIVAGPQIFINAPTGRTVVNGELVIVHIMYNQGSLTINNQMYVAHIFLNFNEWVNNGVVISVGQNVNSSGSFTNNATYLDNGGFFEQGIFRQLGTWHGSADFFNNEFENEGILSPGNSDNFIASYTLFSDYIESGSFKVEIAGTAGAGVFVNGHDKLISNRSVELNGELEVALINGFIPQVGDSFEILSAVNGITGNYSNIKLPTPPAGTAWSYDNNGTSITLSLGVLLAVDLGAFDVVVQNKKVVLDWLSYSEENHDYYQIERSKDLSNWEILGNVKGAGFSNEQINYQFTDYNPMLGNNFYRLVSIDLTGEKEFSEIKQINYSPQEEINITPNLFKSTELKHIYISGLNEGDYTISIIDLSGKEIFTSSKFLNSVDEFSLNKELANGLYILRIENHFIVHTHKILIQ